VDNVWAFFAVTFFCVRMVSGVEEGLPIRVCRTSTGSSSAASVEFTGCSHPAPPRLGVSLVIAVVTGASMMSEWPFVRAFWYAPSATGGPVDPIFGKAINFYLFSLPAWQFIVGWR